MQLDTSLKILAVAALVYLLVQGSKRFFPGICGRYALFLNLILTIVGTVFATRPGTWGAALAIIAQTFAAAGGIHGVIKTLTKDQDADGIKGGGALAVLLLLAIMPLSGCRHRLTPATPATLPAGAVDQIDASSNRVLQAAHGFAQKVSDDAQGKRITLTAPQSKAMNRLNALLNLVDNIELNYHNCMLQHTLAAAPPCDPETLTTYIAGVETAFSDATLTFAPAHAK